MTTATGQIIVTFATPSQRPAFTPHPRLRHFQIDHALIPSQFVRTRRSTQKGNKGESQLSSPSPPSLFSPSLSCASNPQSYPWTSMTSGSVNFGSRHAEGYSPFPQSLITPDGSGIVDRVRSFDSAHLLSLHFRWLRKFHHPLRYWRPRLQQHVRNAERVIIRSWVANNLLSTKTLTTSGMGRLRS